MKVKATLFLILSVLLNFSCNNENTIGQYDFNSVLKNKLLLAAKSSKPEKLDLCEAIPFKWDYILILEPYSSVDRVKKLNLANSKEIEKMLPELTLDEGKCVLLFIAGDVVVKYSYVPRIPIDFTTLKDSENVVAKIPKKIGCEQLYIESGKNTLLIIR